MVLCELRFKLYNMTNIPCTCGRKIIQLEFRQAHQQSLLGLILCVCDVRITDNETAPFQGMQDSGLYDKTNCIHRLVRIKAACLLCSTQLYIIFTCEWGLSSILLYAHHSTRDGYSSL